jgi:hypothetical protein
MQGVTGDSVSDGGYSNADLKETSETAVGGSALEDRLAPAEARRQALITVPLSARALANGFATSFATFTTTSN